MGDPLARNSRFLVWLALLVLVPPWFVHQFGWAEEAIIIVLKIGLIAASLPAVFPVKGLAKLHGLLPSSLSLLAWCTVVLIIAGGLLAVLEVNPVLILSSLFVSLASIAIFRAEVAADSRN